MALVRDRDTKPELRVRRFLHAAGLRYRLHRRIAGARPDLVFPARRTVVFVHGCIWHRHPDSACPLTRMPKTRVAFWAAKFAGNVARDARQVAALTEAGWRVPTIWECRTASREVLAAVAVTQHSIWPLTASCRSGRSCAMTRATLLFEDREVLAGGFIVQMRIWRVAEPVPPSDHRFKYALFFGRPGERIVLFDNERGKGDHCHIREIEYPYTFRGPAQLIEDFKAAVRSVEGARL